MEEVLMGMPGYSNKEYGPHKYDKEGTSDCHNGCGCYAGPNTSGGPLGLDPLHGACPMNPKDGKRLSPDGKLDYEEVVMQRVLRTERRAYEAERKLKAVSPSKKHLAETVELLQSKIAERDFVFRAIKEAVDKFSHLK